MTIREHRCLCEHGRYDEHPTYDQDGDFGPVEALRPCPGGVIRREGVEMAKGAARRKGTPDEPEFRRLIVGLTPELDEALRVCAKLEDRPLAWIVRKALTRYLQERAT